MVELDQKNVVSRLVGTLFQVLDTATQVIDLVDSNVYVTIHSPVAVYIHGRPTEKVDNIRGEEILHVDILYGQDDIADHCDGRNSVRRVDRMDVGRVVVTIQVGMKEVNERRNGVDRKGSGGCSGFLFRDGSVDREEGWVRLLGCVGGGGYGGCLSVMLFVWRVLCRYFFYRRRCPFSRYLCHHDVPSSLRVFFAMTRGPRYKTMSTVKLVSRLRVNTPDPLNQENPECQLHPWRHCDTPNFPTFDSKTRVPSPQE
jgi:hypothetical protein